MIYPLRKESGWAGPVLPKVQLIVANDILFKKLVIEEMRPEVISAARNLQESVW